MSEIGTVLVVGGGIGGLSATIALRRAGVEVDVVEKDPDWSVYGVGIIQPGNALRALDAIGCARRCAERGQPILGDSTWLADGVTMVANHDWPPIASQLPPGNGITRPRLHHILTSTTLESGADVRTGVTTTRVEQRANGVDVEFTDGRRGSYDLVVGADGLYSQTRETVFGGSYRPTFTGQVCWRINLPRIPELDKIWVYLGETGTAGFVPLAQDLMYMLTIEKPPEGCPVRLPRGGIAAVYRERLAGYGGPVAEHRDLVTDDAIVYRPVDDIIVPPPWHRGRVLLIGDAVHGTSPQCGQGGAQAIEDGVVLADEVAKNIPLQQVLDNFMQRRYERCKFIVEGSRRIGEWEQDHSLDIDPDAVRFQVTTAAQAPI